MGNDVLGSMDVQFIVYGIADCVGDILVGIGDRVVVAQVRARLVSCVHIGQ